MSKNLSQIIADLFAKPSEGKALSSQIQYLGDDIRKVILSEDTISGKFRGLLESLRTIVPDEKQRYQAVLQALSTTSKLSRREILKAMSGELEELKIVEKGLAPAQQAWSDGLKGMEARSQQLKGELAQMRERLAQLESDGKTVQASMLAREKDLALAENTVKELFANIGSEIGSFQKKVEELTSEATAAQLAPLPSPKTETPKSDSPVKKVGEQKARTMGAAPRRDTKFQRKCPMCGGPFNLLKLENIWQCFTCAYEEPATDAVPDVGEEKSEPMDAPTPAETPEPIAETASSSIEPASMVNGPAGPRKGSSHSGSQPVSMKKACPVCFKKMIWYPGEKVWRCPSGHHERRGGPSGPGSR